MKNKIISLAIILLLSSSAFLAITMTASAQSVVPGVSKGETFDYSYSIIWTSTDPSATPPSDLVEYNNTQQIQFKITDVSGANINVDFVRIFKNGTQTVQSGSINVESGTVTVPYGFLIVGANLNKNQQIYPTGGHQTITDTITQTYASGQRETNIVSNDAPTEKTTTYFDRIKGIATDFSYEILQTSGNDNITSTERMINTNSDSWSVIPEFPLFIVPLLLIVASSLALVVFKRRRTSSVFNF
jgi:hypothetical protein